MQITLSVSQNLLTRITELDRFQGRWNASPPLPTGRWERVIEASRSQSVAASCRLAGIRMADDEVAALLDGRAVPCGAESREVLGYANALALPLPAADTLLAVDDLKRLQGALVGSEAPPPFRDHTHHREAFDKNGRATGRIFSTLPPHLLDSKLEDLTTWLELELRSGEQHPVLVVGAYVLGVLIASPFSRANGRLSRVLMSRLLARAGYDYVPLASIERQIEELRQPYYEAYDQSQARFWSGEANLTPWLEFYLDVLSRHRQRVEQKIDVERSALTYPPLQQAILDAVRTHGTVDAALLIKATGANRNTLKDNLRRLVERGALERTGQRRGTRYRLAVAEPTAQLD